MIDPTMLVTEACKLADDIEAGRVVPGPALYFFADGAPCCAVGHLLWRCGVTRGAGPGWSEDLGAEADWRIGDLVHEIFAANDHGGDTPKALRKYASGMEQIARRAPAEGKG